jgi:hypothetical protein
VRLVRATGIHRRVIERYTIRAGGAPQVLAPAQLGLVRREAGGRLTELATQGTAEGR